MPHPAGITDRHRKIRHFRICRDGTVRIFHHIAEADIGVERLFRALGPVHRLDLNLIQEKQLILQPGVFVILCRQQVLLTGKSHTLQVVVPRVPVRIDVFVQTVLCHLQDRHQLLLRQIVQRFQIRRQTGDLQDALRRLRNLPEDIGIGIIKGRPVGRSGPDRHPVAVAEPVIPVCFKPDPVLFIFIDHQDRPKRLHAFERKRKIRKRIECLSLRQPFHGVVPRRFSRDRTVGFGKIREIIFAHAVRDRYRDRIPVVQLAGMIHVKIQLSEVIFRAGLRKVDLPVSVGAGDRHVQAGKGIKRGQLTQSVHGETLFFSLETDPVFFRFRIVVLESCRDRIPVGKILLPVQLTLQCVAGQCDLGAVFPVGVDLTAECFRRQILHDLPADDALFGHRRGDIIQIGIFIELNVRRPGTVIPLETHVRIGSRIDHRGLSAYDHRNNDRRNNDHSRQDQRQFVFCKQPCPSVLQIPCIRNR